MKPQQRQKLLSQRSPGLAGLVRELELLENAADRKGIRGERSENELAES